LHLNCIVKILFSKLIMTDLALFFGRFHPTFLHLPIGMVLIAFLMEVFSRFKSFRYLSSSINFVLSFGAFTAIVAAAMGYFLSQEGGYNEELLLIHQWLGIGTAVMAFLLWLLRWRITNRGNLTFSKAYFMLWLILLTTLTLAGHYGGSLTHGENYLTEYMPSPLKQLAGINEVKKKRNKPTDINEAIVFEEIILPILEKKCVSCHNAEKKKGDLILTNAENFLKGGEHGAIFKAGNAKESGIYMVVTLPRTDEYAMPPEGKEPMTEEETKLLAWWIDEGADFSKKVKELTPSQEIANILGIANSNAMKAHIADILPSLKANPAETTLIESLRKLKIDVKPVAHNSPFLQVKINQEVSDEQLDALQKITEQTTWLDLKRTNITDNQLGKLSSFKNLTELHLELTNISDEGLKHLETLTNLQYLNLYSTKVSDAGLKSLEKLPHLRSLYLWQTKVTPTGVANLQKEKPLLKIDTGMDKAMLDSLITKKL